MRLVHLNWARPIKRCTQIDTHSRGQTSRWIGKIILHIFKNIVQWFVNIFMYDPSMIYSDNWFYVLFLQNQFQLLRLSTYLRHCADCNYTNGPSSVLANVALGLFLCAQYFSYSLPQIHNIRCANAHHKHLPSSMSRGYFLSHLIFIYSTFLR